jgi:glycosyltransferase involved in cell wall biosynthesis
LYRIGFVIEQALGHITHGQNLRRFVADDASLESAWCLPAWQRSGLASRLPVYRSNWTVQTGWQTRRLLASLRSEFRPQALFFHTQVTATLAQDWLGRVPSIVSLDATPRQIDQLGDAYQHSSGPAWLEQAKWRLNHRTFRLARQLVTWSAWAKQGLMDEYECPPQKITVIPPGVDTTLWTPGSPRLPESGAVRILFVGADFQRKGGPVLLEAFRRLRQVVSSAGSASDPCRLVELHVVTRDNIPSEPGLVVHNDLEPNSAPLRQLYGECDLFCLPTQADCLPIALMEAGAAGLPLVSTNVAAIPEIVMEGQTGLLVPPGDPVALAGALGRLAADRPLRLALGAGASGLVQRAFSAQTNTQRLLALLKAVVDERPGA